MEAVAAVPGLKVENSEASNVDADIARLIHEAAQPTADTREFMEPKGAPKKRGRPPTHGKYSKAGPIPDPQPQPQAQAAPVPGALTPEQELAAKQSWKKGCEGIFKALSGALVRQTRVEDVALSKEEVEALSDAWADVAMIYAPEVMKRHGALIVACGITAGVGFRITGELDKEIKRRQAVKKGQEKTVEAQVSNLHPGGGVQA
jgi:hypothetical protein